MASALVVGADTTDEAAGGREEEGEEICAAEGRVAAAARAASAGRNSPDKWFRLKAGSEQYFINVFPVIVSGIWVDPPRFEWRDRPAPELRYILSEHSFGAGDEREPFFTGEGEQSVSRPKALVSIIIPALNEEHTISSVLRSLARQERISDCEVIVVDGGSRDRTVEVAENFPFVRIETSAPGRAVQMNHGAEAATAPALWFLHVDSTLPDRRTVDALLEALDDPAVVAGCFRFHLRGDDLYYRLINALVNLRARALGRPYGDQGIFVRRELFLGLGGFRPSAADCEDLDFVLRVREQGEFRLLPATVETSARTWKRYGKVATTFWHLNQWLRFEWSRRRNDPAMAALIAKPAEAQGTKEVTSAATPDAH